VVPSLSFAGVFDGSALIRHPMAKSVHHRGNRHVPKADPVVA